MSKNVNDTMAALAEALSRGYGKPSEMLMSPRQFEELKRFFRPNGMRRAIDKLKKKVKK